MLNFGVLETIQIIKRRRLHFQDVAAGLATFDDVELAVAQRLMSLRAGRADADDFGEGVVGVSESAAASRDWSCVAAGLIMKQIDDALVELRNCMYDGMGDEDKVSSGFREERAQKAVAELDPRLFSVPLCAPLQMKIGSFSESDVQTAVTQDHRFNKYQLHLRLRRQTELPPADATSAISNCIPGWPTHAATTLQPSPSPSMVPAFLQAIKSSQPCVYGERRREGSTWRQKHKRQLQFRASE